METFDCVHKQVTHLNAYTVFRSVVGKNKHSTITSPDIYLMVVFHSVHLLKSLLSLSDD